MLSTKGTQQVQIFSQLLALKLTKFLVIFQATSQFSLQLHFGQKEPMKVQIFKFLSALMEVHPIPNASFETTRSRFAQILQLCSLYFLSQTLNSPNSLSCLKLQASFSLNFSSLFSVMRNSSVLFS